MPFSENTKWGDSGILTHYKIIGSISSSSNEQLRDFSTFVESNVFDVLASRRGKGSVGDRHALRRINQNGDEVLVGHDIRRDQDRFEQRDEEERQRGDAPGAPKSIRR